MAKKAKRKTARKPLLPAPTPGGPIPGSGTFTAAKLAPILNDYSATLGATKTIAVPHASTFEGLQEVTVSAQLLPKQVVALDLSRTTFVFGSFSGRHSTEPRVAPFHESRLLTGLCAVLPDDEQTPTTHLEQPRELSNAELALLTADAGCRGVFAERVLTYAGSVAYSGQAEASPVKCRSQDGPEIRTVRAQFDIVLAEQARPAGKRGDAPERDVVFTI